MSRNLNHITNTEGCAADGVWEPFNVAKAWNINTPNSLVKIYAKFRDGAGNESECVSASITHDNIPPTDTIISINSGAAETTSTSVQLALTANDAERMYITNTSGCDSSGIWESY